MDGDTWDAGYNLALTGRPVENMNLSVTYRSKVDLGVEGDATLRTSAGPGLYAGATGWKSPCRPFSRLRPRTPFLIS